MLGTDKNLNRIKAKHLLAGTIAVATFIVHTGIIGAGELPKESFLPLELARKAASTAVKKCREGGYMVSAAVVDRAGVAKVVIRDDGAGAHTVDSSKRKAYTAASLREPTRKLAGLIGKRPELQALRDMNDSILILGGGLPVRIDGEVVGGIGVGGAPGAGLDEACALEGLRVIGADTHVK